MRTARSEYLSLLHGVTYFLALIVAGSAGLLASVATTFPPATRAAFAAFGLIIAAVLVLLVHQPINRTTVASVILLASAFIVPATLVRTTWESAGCVVGVPCDPWPNDHLGLRLGLAGTFLLAALVTAAIEPFSSKRSPAASRPETAG